MNSPDWLRRLPSVNEILDKPPLRGVVAKWNRSTVAARVRSFLEEIREEVQARTGEISVSELAERAARYVLGPAERGAGAAINATGQLWGEPWHELPLAEDALNRVVQTARDYTADGSFPEFETPAHEAERLACQLCDAEAAALWNSRLGALESTLRSLAGRGSVVVSRGEVAQLTRHCRLTDLTAAVGAHLLEVGAIDATSSQDFAAAIAAAPAAILRIEPEDYFVVGQTQRPTVAELANLANKTSTPLIVDLGRNPLIDGLPTDGRDVITAKQALADGASLVLVRTDGFVGGPPGALLLGKAEFVEPIKRQPLSSAHRAGGMTATALAATLERCRDLDQARFAIPLLSLLDTPLENLRTRAERLAPQMSGPTATSAAAVALTAPANRLPRSCRLPSWGIALAPRNGDVAALTESLARAIYPVIGRPEDDRLILDLRTVFPRQDMDVVSAISGS
ncbi:MAG: hypothetical protein WD851_15010 [Pirellulales bacterium]